MSRAAAGVLLGWALFAPLPAQAGAAALVYTKGALAGDPEVWIANANGTGPRRLASGDTPQISPDGTMVAYSVDGRSGKSAAPITQVRVVPAGGGVSRVLTSVAGAPEDNSPTDEGRGNTAIVYADSFAIAWSPDSRLVAVSGTRNTTGGLLVIDVASGAARKIGGGSVGRAAFSPDSTSIADLSVDGYLNIADLGSGVPQRSAGSNTPVFAPAWGPSEIAFVTNRGSIAVVNSDGRGYRRLALRKQITEGGQGLVQILGWTGSSIVVDAYCSFGCQSRLVAIDSATGAMRELRQINDKQKLTASSASLDVSIPVAMSRDGSAVLAQRLAFTVRVGKRITDISIPVFKLQIVEIASTGSAPQRVLADGAAPDWNR